MRKHSWYDKTYVITKALQNMSRTLRTVYKPFMNHSGWKFEILPFYTSFTRCDIGLYQA